MSADESVKQRFLDVVGAYEQTIVQLTERIAAREAEDKERLTVLEAENRRLKATEDVVDDLQLKLQESKHLLASFQDNEQKLLDELKKQHRELLQSKSAYQALSGHAQSKLKEAQQYLAKIQEAQQQELSVVKAKLARVTQQNLTLQQNLEASQQENKNLLSVAQQLLAKLDKGDTSNLETIRAMLSTK